jgi:hypothetical protein
MIAVMTTWRAVRDFEGIYEVSDQGQVRSLGRVVKGRDGSDRYINGKVISQRERPDGTKIVNLWRSITIVSFQYAAWSWRLLTSRDLVVMTQ